MNKISLWFYSLRWLPKRMLQSIGAVGRLLYFKPHYLLLAVVVSVVFYEIIFWLMNLGLAHYLLTTPFLTVMDKLELIVRSYTGIVTPPFSRLAMTLFVVSLLQGVAVAGIVYVIRAQKQRDKTIVKQMSGAGIAGILSALGLGCAACGTSLLMPVIAFFFASSSAALSDTIGFYSVILALIAALITVHIIGLKVAMVQRSAK